MFFFIIFLFLMICFQVYTEGLSNYTNSVVSCHNRGGLITLEQLKFDGLINITCKISVKNGFLNGGKSVWVQGHAQSGPYIALHTCMRYSNQDEHSFATNRTFYSNILYECSVFCDRILQSMGYLGIYKDLCFCMYYSFRFPNTPECLENDFLDIHKGIIVFRLMGNLEFDVQSTSNFNCLAVSFPESGMPSYYTIKCSSQLSSICTQRVDSDLSNKCLHRLAEFCFNEEKVTFLEHNRKCWLYNGILLPFNPGITVSFNSVILGSFRAFKAIENDRDYTGNATWSCLSITKVNGIIYLETENCSNENDLICMDDTHEASIADGSWPKGYTMSLSLLFVLLKII